MRYFLYATFLAMAMALAAPVDASSGSSNLQASGASLSDRGSLQNGAKLFFNYCSGCHSLKLMRYSRIASDLGLTEQQVMDNLNFTGAKFGEQIPPSMSAADGKTWFGAAPPDLSLMARARGVDYIYTYLKSFYLDPTRPLGWNNTVFPNASMPNALWSLQGIQTATFKAHGSDVTPVFEKFELHQAGSLDAHQFDEVARDIANFLQYAAEPAALQRKSVGVWVLLFLGVFTLLAWLLKQEYWKDVH
ncbi:MAG: cytochrome c1 [Xanthomonadales bacterium]|nr:cytochrome c1 [Xanthomonadales bacterium]